jgi:AmiR/NasT family two-component response regulator
MASRRCSADEAFQMLVQASQRNNAKLRDIAARIVTSQASEQRPAV